MTRRGEATRARLIEATRDVVREAGYAHASTRAIAKAAGVAEGTIYRHFRDKASLFLAAVMEANAPIIAWVTALPDRAGKSTVEENLADAAVRLASLRDEILPLELAIAAYLAAEQRLGRVREDVDPREAAGLLLGVLFALGIMPVTGDVALGPDRVASAVRLMVRGVQPTAPDPEP